DGIRDLTVTGVQTCALPILGDIGITSSLFPDENHTAAQTSCARAPNGGQPEIADELLRKVAVYARLLGVPARRDLDDPAVRRGEIGRASCRERVERSMGGGA